jgi:hypothetical protein
MSYSAVEEKLHAIPEQYLEQVSMFLDLLLNLAPKSEDVQQEHKPSGHPIPGLAKGEFLYPDDINLYDDEIAEMFGV